MNKLTKEEFYVLSTQKQFKYINELSNEYSHGDWLVCKNGAYFDVDIFEEIEDLYEYLIDINVMDGCDLYQKCFKEL
jgi:hypothetical protein